MTEAETLAQKLDAFNGDLAREAAALLRSQAAEIERLRVDAERYRWLAKEHSWWLLKHFPSPRYYLDATEVIDEAIDAAMKENKHD